MKKISLIGLVILLGFSKFYQAESFKSFRMAWISDTHIGANQAAHDLDLIVKDINSISEIEFIIVSGDISEMDTGSNLKMAKLILDQLTKPYYIIPGNHDLKWSQSGGNGFIALWGRDRFDFIFHGIRWIGFHQGPLMKMADGIVSPEDLIWLDSLQSTIHSDSIGTVFVTHYPMDSSVSNYYQVIDRMKKMNPIVLFHGHGHSNQSYNYNGIPGIMSRSSLADQGNPTGYTLVDFQADSLCFTERNPVQKLEKIWHQMAWSVVPANLINPEYPDFQAENTHSGVKESWSYQSHSTIAATPAVAEGMVIMVNRGGQVIALNVKTGKSLWTYRVSRALVASPAVNRGKVVITACDSSVYCLNLKNGTLVWKLKTKAPLVSTPTIQDDTVYFGSSDHHFRAVDLEYGKILWDYQDVSGFIEAKPLVIENDIIFGAWDGYLYNIDRQAGTLKWKWNEGRVGALFSPAVCYPVALDNRIFIVAPDRYTTIINRETGKTIWRSNRFKVRESIGMSQDKQSLFLHTMRDTIAAVSAASDTMKVKWISKADFGYDFAPSIPVEKDGVVYFGTRRGEILALDSQNGKVIWRYRSSVGLIHNLIPLNNHRLLVSGLDGRICCLEW